MSNIDTRSPFFPHSKTGLNETQRSKNVGSSSINGKNPFSNGVETPNQDARVNIPDGVKDFSRIKKAVDAAPEVDNSEKIARLKAQIQAGTYEVDYDALADKMLTSEF